MMPAMNPQDCIFHLLSKASRSGAQYFKKSIAELGLTPVQAKTLNFLYHDGESTAGELCQRMAVDSATLTGLLDRMEKQSWISRQSCQSDGRVMMIGLTQSGLSLAEQVSSLAPEANASFLKQFSDAEKMMLTDLLQRL